MFVGYLKEEGCIASYRIFLKEMRHLEEFRTMMAAGCEYPTSIGGKTLKTMLSEYGSMMLHGKYHLLITGFYVICICHPIDFVIS